MLDSSVSGGLDYRKSHVIQLLIVHVHTHTCHIIHCAIRTALKLLLHMKLHVCSPPSTIDHIVVTPPRHPRAPVAMTSSSGRSTSPSCVTTCYWTTRRQLTSTIGRNNTLSTTTTWETSSMALTSEVNEKWSKKKSRCKNYNCSLPTYAISLPQNTRLEDSLTRTKATAWLCLFWELETIVTLQVYIYCRVANVHVHDYILDWPLLRIVRKT